MLNKRGQKQCWDKQSSLPFPRGKCERKQTSSYTSLPLCCPWYIIVSFTFNLHACDSQVNISAVLLLITDTLHNLSFNYPLPDAYLPSFQLSSLSLQCSNSNQSFYFTSLGNPRSFTFSISHVSPIFFFFLLSQLKFYIYFNYFFANFHNSIFCILVYHNLLANTHPI